MRILQVIHQYPPFSSQGSEVYCAGLAQHLRRSADVRVFHVSNPLRRTRRGLHRSTHAGVPAWHCVDGGAYARLAAWPNRLLRESFQTVLDEFAPDLVHFHNYISLGDHLVGMAGASGAAVVYTLHDYGLICPNALLRRDDGALCGKQDPDFFQDCCPVLVRSAGTARTTAPWWGRLPSLPRWQMFSRQQPNPAVRTVLGTATAGATRLLGDPRSTDVADKRDFFLDRTRRIFHDADLFIAPSRFLLERYASCGVPREKLVFMRYGMQPLPPMARVPRTGDLRVGFIGALHPHKGVETLLEAFRGIQGATLHVHGSVFASPISDSYSRRIREGSGASVIFHGAYDNDRVAEILARLDVLVVPSLWYENSPLTIQEAFMAGVPVITGADGGMAELVEHEVSGLRFRIGDAADLRAALERVIAEPGLLDQLRAGIPPVARMDAHAAAMLERYGNVLISR